MHDNDGPTGSEAELPRVSLASETPGPLPVVFYRHERTHADVVASIRRLVHQNAFKAMVLNAAAEGIMGVDANGVISYANAAAARLWGGRPADLRGLALAAVIEDVPAPAGIARAYDACINGVERLFIRRDGSAVPVSYHHTPIRGTQASMGAVVSFIDLSQCKALEAEMRTSERMLAEAEVLAGLGSWEWAVAEDRLCWSDGLYHLFGLDPHTSEATFEAYLQRIHPDDVARVRETLEEAVHAGRAFGFQHRIVLASGEVRTLQVRGRVLTDGRGLAVKLLGAAQDVTDRVRAEERERQIELMQAADALKDQILDTLSHELRTPISVISGFTSILQEQLAGPLTGDQAEYLDQIQGEADHLLKLINDLLELSRIQAGKLLLYPRPVHLGEIVKDVLTQLMPVAAEKKQRLVDEVPAELPLVPADDARIAEVLTQLLANAIKFAPEGSTTRIRARVDGGALRCEIEDSGARIPDDEIPKLFQRFTQLDMSTTRRFGGVGIGLFISKALIEAHHGTIGLSRAAGGTHGNTFWFTLPLGPEAGMTRAA